MGCIYRLFLFLGRICLAIAFIWDAQDKIMHFSAHEAMISAAGIVEARVFVIASCILELVCGGALLLGYRARLMAFLLAIYIGVITLLLHGFWRVSEGDGYQLQMKFFFSNLAIFGGLLCIMGAGPGLASCEKCRVEEDVEE